MISSFEAEIRKQIEAKQAQRQAERDADIQMTLNQYRNYPMPGGKDPSLSDQHRSLQQAMQQAHQSFNVQNGAPFQGNMNVVVFDQKPTTLFDDQFMANQNNNPIKDLSQMGERERRIYLRDRERELRNQLPPAGVNAPVPSHNVEYGGMPSTQVQAPQSAPGLSRREQMLQQKAQQRQSMQELPAQLLHEYSQLPQPTQFQEFQPQPFQQLTPAYQQQKQQDLMSSYPVGDSLALQSQKEAPSLPSVGNGLLIGGGLEEAELREKQKRKLQTEYQQYLAQQEKSRIPKQSPSYQDQLQMGGLQQIGEHHYRSQQEKQQKQVQYKLQLELQQRQKETPKETPSKKQLYADMIFNEVMDSNRGAPLAVREPPQSQRYRPVEQQPPPVNMRIQSAVGANRQSELERLQMQQTTEMFKSEDQETKRRKELDRKREYAQSLQQQMEMKKQRQSAPPQLQPTTPTQASYQPREQLQQVAYQPQHFREQDYQQDQSSQPQQVRPCAVQGHFNAKEEYRRQLEQQMREAEDKKRKQKEQQLAYDRRYDKDIAEVIQSSQPTQQRRGQTDITKTPTNEDETRIKARLKYQEELKEQMELQKLKKEELARQRKIEEEIEEQRLLKERQSLAGKERREMHQEGKKAVTEEQPRRQVNRSQFEQSKENGGKPRELFLNSPPVVEIASMPTSDYVVAGEYSLGPQKFNMPPTPTVSSFQMVQDQQQFQS